MNCVDNPDLSQTPSFKPDGQPLFYETDLVEGCRVRGPRGGC